MAAQVAMEVDLPPVAEADEREPPAAPDREEASGRRPAGAHSSRDALVAESRRPLRSRRNLAGVPRAAPSSASSSSQRAPRARSTASLVSYFQVSRTQPTEPSLLVIQNDSSSDETVVLSDSESSGNSSSPTEDEEEQARSLEEIPLIGLEVIVSNQMAPPRDTSNEIEHPDSRVTTSQPKKTTPLKKSNPAASLVPLEEDSGDTCAICFEEWTNAGEHRLAALRCGHLFGYSCIERWLRGQVGKCPQCNKKAKRTDIVVLYARTLKALDTTEQENMKSLTTNTVVQTYNASRPIWCCCWCLDDTNYVYAGLANGSILVYDLRDTNSYVQELAPQKSRCPVVSLSYLPRMASVSLPCGGLVSGTLEGACFWEQKSSNSYRPHDLLLEPGGCIDLQTEASTRHCLATFRPNRNNNCLQCVVMELTSTQLTDRDDEIVCSCNSIQTLTAGPTCKLLTKNAIFQSPEDDGSILVCAGDEATNSAMLWDAGSGTLLQKLPADLPVLDVCPFEVNRNSFLATLTEKMVKIYKWQ
ncbi:hypothetical protein E2320_001005 [Naja naja]|nr:hypothetical protein E2320_001005 [Naja naja]